MGGDKDRGTMDPGHWPVWLAERRDLLRREEGILGGFQFGRVYWQPEVWIAGMNYTGRALGMHPPAGACSATFAVPHGAQYFVSLVGLAREDPKPDQFGDALFQVQLDGEVVAAERIAGGTMTARIKIRLRQPTSTVTLITDSLGSNYADHATWADPRFVPTDPG